MPEPLDPMIREWKRQDEQEAIVRGALHPKPRALTGGEIEALRGTHGEWCVGCNVCLLLAHIAALERELFEYRQREDKWNESKLMESNLKWFEEAKKVHAEAAALERQVAEARAENERLRHGLDEEGLSLAERCCGSIKDHLAKRAEEAERQRDRALEEVEAGLQISGSFFVALKPLKLQAINVTDPGQHVAEVIRQRDAAGVVLRQEIAPNDRERYIYCRLCGGTWWPDERTRHHFDCVISALDAAWPTWREGAGGETGNG